MCAQETHRFAEKIQPMQLLLEQDVVYVLNNLCSIDFHP